MTRPSAQAVRRTAVDLSDQMGPHLSHAKDVMVETVIPKARETMVETVIPKARDAKDVMVETVIPKAKDTMVDTVLPKARETMVETVIPKAKATGVGLAMRAGLVEAPKQRHPWRKAAIVGVIGVGAYAAWNAWRLPRQSDDWTQPDPAMGGVRTDDRTEGEIPGVPVETNRSAF